MIVLDTNVISELMKASPDARVSGWLGSQRSADCFISSIAEAELRYGIEVLPPGHRRQQLEVALNAMLTHSFSGRVLPFDSAAAIAFATISAGRRRAGRPISQMDAQIAAIAQANGAVLATRNIGDFQGCGVVLIDPWSP
jgi:hypothetical protein